MRPSRKRGEPGSIPGMGVAYDSRFDSWGVNEASSTGLFLANINLKEKDQDWQRSAVQKLVRLAYPRGFLGEVPVLSLVFSGDVV